MVSAPALIWKEMRHRPFTSMLGVATVASAVGLVVFFLTTAAGAERETKRIQRDLGFNVRIVAADVASEDLWLRGWTERTMPDTYLEKLANQETVSINHVVGILQMPFTVGTTRVLLTGITASANTPGRAEAKMRPVVRKGTVELGFEAARLLAVAKGDAVDIGGQKFQVAQVLLEKGTEEDLRVYGNLAEVQKILGKKGQISEIRAVDCLCLRPADKPLDQLRDELRRLLPDTRILLDHDRAAVRAQQRHMIEGYLGLLLPVVVGAAAVAIAALMLSNARSRNQEVGLLRALGRPTWSILVLFLGKALVLGVLGSVLGAAAGTLLAVTLGPEVFQLTAANVRPLPGLMILALTAGPLLTVVASLAPAAYVATIEPAAVLREE